MTPLPPHLPLKLNFSLKPLPKTTLDDLELVPPSLLPSDCFMLPIKILCNDVFHALAGLNPQKAYEPDGVPPIVLQWENMQLNAKKCNLVEFGKSARKQKETTIWEMRNY